MKLSGATWGCGRRAAFAARRGVAPIHQSRFQAGRVLQKKSLRACVPSLFIVGAPSLLLPHIRIWKLEEDEGGEIGHPNPPCAT